MLKRFVAGKPACGRLWGRLVLCGCLLAGGLPAWAALTITINSPAEGATVTPGQRVYYSVTVSGPVAGIHNISITGLDGFIVAPPTYPASPPTNSVTVSDPGIAFVDIPIGQPAGSATLITVTADGWADEPIFASRTVTVQSAGPDTAAPTFTAGQVGIHTATRLEGNTSADLTWYQATDDRTLAADLVYEVYVHANQSLLFTQSPSKLVTGALLTTITGLDPLTSVYIGVRAKDEAGNRDANTVSILLDPLPNAADDSWMLYQ